jgi:hypothetical protein
VVPLAIGFARSDPPKLSTVAFPSSEEDALRGAEVENWTRSGDALVGGAHDDAIARLAQAGGESADLPNLLNGSVDSCQRGSTTGLAMSAIGNPPSGLQWYLVRGWNTGGFGSPGNATAGTRTQNSGGACP